MTLKNFAIHHIFTMLGAACGLIALFCFRANNVELGCLGGAVGLMLFYAAFVDWLETKPPQSAWSAAFAVVAWVVVATALATYVNQATAAALSACAKQAVDVWKCSPLLPPLNFLFASMISLGIAHGMTVARKATRSSQAIAC